MMAPAYDFTPGERAAIVARADHLAGLGRGIRAQAGETGIPVATLTRWRAELAAHGGDAHAAFAPRQKTGRPPAIEFDGELEAIARWHRLTKGSLALAVHFFCQDARVPRDLAARILEIQERALAAGREPSFPPSIRRAFYVTAAEMAAFRGRKAELAHEMVSARGMFWIDEDGETRDLLPGQLMEADDYSTNQPYVWRDPSAEGGLNLGRQILACMDVCSGGWLGFDHIGRERDAYRGEDILRFLARIFRAHGMPLILRLERGSWESSFVHGIKVEGMAKPWGGLDEMIRIKHVWKSKAKGLIENSFNSLQSWLGHTGQDIGRHRGEFEAAQKAWRAACNTGADPLALGFLSQEASGEAHEAAAREMNRRPRTRRALGERVAPDDLRARLGWHTVPVPAAEAWRLLPYKERRVINCGVVEGLEAAKRGWPLTRWIVNQDGLHLENGHAVLVAYDPARPDLGCHVCNAETGPRNRHGWHLGQYLCTAPIEPATPQINLSGKVHPSVTARKTAAAGARTSFRAIVAAGRETGREVVATDGRVTVGHGTLADAPQDLGRTTAADGIAARAREESGLAGLGRVAPANQTDRLDRTATPEVSQDRAALLARAQAQADALLFE